MKTKKKKKQIKKTHYLRTCLITVFSILLVVGVYFFLTTADEQTNLTILEKQWISKNSKTLIDINVPNNLSVLADDGNGVVFEYLKTIEDGTGLSFNKNSYNYPTKAKNLSGLSILVLDGSDSIQKDDILISEDNYVLISGKDVSVGDVETTYGQKVGILGSDKKNIERGIGNGYNYITYENVNQIIYGLKKGTISYGIVPRYYTLSSIVSNGIYINHTFNNLTNKVVLRLNDNDRLSSIISKYLETFKASSYLETYEKSFMDFYSKTSSTTDLETRNLSSKVYTYGYVKGSGYNKKKNGNLYGYASEYIGLLSNMASIEFEYKEYKSSKDLENAITNKEVDIAFIDFEYQNNYGLFTDEAFYPEMIALSETNYQINGKQGLNNRKLYTLKGTYLEKYLKKNYTGVLNPIKDVTSSIPEDGILLLDEIDYYYYSNKGKLGDYYSLLKDSYEAPYRFYVQKEEQSLYDFMNFVLMYADSSDVKMNTINKLIGNTKNKASFKSLYLIVVLVIVLPIMGIFLLAAFAKTHKNIKILRKEDILKYNDMLTSLKNRNYLRAHIDEWDEVKVTPRTIIVIDLNNLKYVNDHYGEEEGNMLIKKAAAILINTQLEKSEIIRSDGNEFTIYLVGYTKTQINTYINKLSKEFEKLPYNFGAAIGYSMIDDEIKTIGDAISEAAIAMRKDKEENYK